MSKKKGGKKNWSPILEFIYPALIFFGALYSWYNFSGLEAKEAWNSPQIIDHTENSSIIDSTIEDLP